MISRVATTAGKLAFGICLLALTTMRANAQGSCPAGLPVSGTKCFFIAGSGSDSNNGTSESTPWLHAPGMPNCTGTCASTTPAAGEGFIFRGGDSWHTANSSATVFTGSNTSSCSFGISQCGWVWSWSGTSASCNYPTTTSSCIYIGVDKAWYSAASFTRPVLNLDNPTWANSAHQDSSNSGFVTACSYDDYDRVGMVINANYVLMDNFEDMGLCLASPASNGGASTGAYIYSANQTNTVEESYFHGWSEAHVTTSAMDYAAAVSGALLNFSYNVVDGSDDGMPCNAIDTCSGNVELSPVSYFDHNVVRMIANGAGGGYLLSLHDNLFEYSYVTWDNNRHTDIYFTYGNSAPVGSTTSVYNNIIRHTNNGQDLSIDPSSGGKLYIFNNILWDNGNGGNCINVQGTDTNPATAWIANNTLVSDTATCYINFSNNGNLVYLHGALNLENNHFVGSGSSVSSYLDQGSNSNVTITDYGNEVLQTVSAANSQGYVGGNNYQPTSTSGATYHAGANLSSSCANFSSDSALCSGSTGGVTDDPGSGALPVPYISLPTLRAANWDAGAYQFANTNIVPATGLSAIVH